MEPNEKKKTLKLPGTTRHADTTADELHDGGTRGPLRRLLQTRRRGVLERREQLPLAEFASAQRLHRRLPRHRLRSLIKFAKQKEYIYIR